MESEVPWPRTLAVEQVKAPDMERETLAKLRMAEEVPSLTFVTLVEEKALPYNINLVIKCTLIVLINNQLSIIYLSVHVSLFSFFYPCIHVYFYLSTLRVFIFVLV